MEKPFLTVVVPCYNEEEVLSESVTQLTNIIQKLVMSESISDKSQIMFVDDGSKDRTWELIQQYSESNEHVSGLKLSRNYGHQGALLAGLTEAHAYSDCVVSIDADLQDDVNAIIEFIEKYHEGFDVVYGVRDKRDTDTYFKRNSALAFYRIMSKLGVNMVPNHADYRLLSKRALTEFLRYKEENMFIRGIVPLLGFKSTKVFYNRNERFAGESKYPLKKMVLFAVDGITSFSVAPIRLLLVLGSVIFMIGVVMGIYAIVQKIVGAVVPGWTSLIVSLWLIGGIQLIGIGVLGEYIGKIFKQVKERPRFTIEENVFEMKCKENKINER
ncbi:glycosyltransferase family 2 protein [Listeria cossartiae subsp. cayugensis]|uniref:Glycosyltransferase family 2 protein n=1 Tax=Listeria cossartiae subsp. cayugensis TaxID=2713505 RepID=A0A7X1DBB1_9LIST|nr:glycosyltransferase family 2 protein [Listeria cossartiae]MBC2249156.1 glycosyltransferase family 2 protein [Listeria cossartiae subsp. cayugensis]MDT0002695.1 glycosyltransferase family 2 protein [Listeria cossartiae subsp. cayugensis]MDT0013485.1 glycosyltransferase family 2 protein [Listeria cossartiae subsp. cayugensis]MDT0018937.1 glycosyltransferase family 2 protein [Listeria cossartiae subsp. cayugensis]MDT0035490.1 glycosyltransferase family 2 protein [Listeria cossartiae subsp. cay